MALSEKVAVITGATGALGRTAAFSLAAQGARLALVSTSSLKLENLAQEIGGGQTRVLPCEADLRDPASTERAAGRILDAFGRVDILLHLVGGWTGGRALVDTPPNDLEDMLGQHVWTTFNLIQAFVPPLVAGGWGRIVIVSSPSAQRPAGRGGAYAAAKAAQESLLLTLAQEVKDTRLTANILQVRTIDVQHERDQNRTAANASWTTPEEITAAVLYLCSDEAGVMNGARIPLYGGG